MRLFRCSVCAHALYFENHRCERCGNDLGFLPDRQELAAVRQAEAGVLHPLGVADGAWRPCAHLHSLGCNWLVPADTMRPWCVACDLNRTIPDLSVAANVERWQMLERAKRRLVYGLLRLRLPVVSRAATGWGLAFDFLADSPLGPPVLTGHVDGVITVNVAEADPVEGMRRREQLDEPYRTPLGHLRHEIAHYYWPTLVPEGPLRDDFRAVFGDERQNYAAALDRHYAQGQPWPWHQQHISAYAAAHPWEDWAETFAHYLHIVDALETALAFGIRLGPDIVATASLDQLGDPYCAASARALVGAWLPLTFAMNSLNRSMGLGDLYPFVLTEPVIAKLEAVHRFVQQESGSGP